MIEARVPTAQYQIVNSYDETLEASKHFQKPYVLKADGLCAGKGVFICKDDLELKEAAHKIFTEKIFGEAGTQALFEEPLMGWEMSLLVLTNGSKYEILPVAMDHKRLKDNDLGPNTGGMGTIAPMKISKDLMNEIEATIVFPTVKTLQHKNYIYRGVLFFGLMITPSGPKVLEYNVRFGDPETQVILPLLDIDFGFLFKSLAEGQLPTISQKPFSCCCVVLSAEGYPDHPVKGSTIEGDLFYETNSSYFLHAGTKQSPEGWCTQGGRVLNAVGIGSDAQAAIQAAYNQAEKVKWKGLQKRTDIGAYLPIPTKTDHT
nr:phosphoribosylamine--glycine ligase [Pseudobdellovibrionaceae bacterium]